MSAVNLLSSMKEKPVEENKKDDSNQEGHEENGVSNGGAGDPAVLAVGPARRPFTYTREELLHLRNSPLVKHNLENAFAGCDALALVLKKRPDSPNEEDRGARGDVPSENHKPVFGRERERRSADPRERRSADPRERVRKESETTGGGAAGIVLSPQRRSFTSGCGAPSAAPPQPPHVARTRPESPLSTPAPTQPKTEQVGRRIGSGRIMLRDVPSGGGGGGWDEPEYRAEPYRPPHRDRDHRPNGESRLERRSFSRDSYSDMKRDREDRYDKPREREDNRRSGGRYNQRRYDKDEEPEWFSAGPTSQLETIELRGFDEPTKKSNNTNSKDEKWGGRNQSPAERAERSDRAEKLEKWRDTSSPLPAQTFSANNDTADTSNDKDSGVESKTDEVQQNNEQPEFNIEEFLKFDTLPDVLTNGVGETETGSRFSRWFRRESPSNDKHYERLLHTMVDDLDNSTRLDTAPAGSGSGSGGGVSDPQNVFAPISPAGGQPRPLQHQPTFLDLLLRPNQNRSDSVSGGGGGGKIHSLAELEAGLRPQPPQQTHNVPDHDLTAFKRLLAQVSGGHAVAAAAEPVARHHQQQQHHHQLPQPMSLMQMLKESMEQQQKAQQQQQQQQQQQPPHIPHELVYKLLQVQQRQQHQQQQPQPPSVVNEMGHIGGVLPPSDRELLQRPEAQAILQGLKAGEITVQHLMQQLNNPGLQSRHREILLTILRLHQQQRQMGGSPLPVSLGNTSHLVVPPHHQPLRLSPLPHQGVPGRIPSPRELAAHTQSIMQGALIKKKLEEQRENYRRRHEMQQQHQPKQPTPISFTPTSVLRKMTAEKESEAPTLKQQQQWSQPSKVPQGRPIVKGNQSGTSLPMGYSNQISAEYQQHYMNQQMASGTRPFSLPQQRQQLPNSFNNMNNTTRGIPGGTTLHQLLVQSHQRSLNEMGGGGGGVGTGGGDNQLARWFSPELLARASAGKLPSVHVPNALSLEDLERHHHSPAPPLRN